MPTQRRWLQSVIAAAAQPMPALPWERRTAGTVPPAVTVPPRPAAVAAR
jgi:hypothetical protein